MHAWRTEFLEQRREAHDAFWHRKSHKIVLAVVALHLGDGHFTYVRGCNLEVSMPSGSLCAERNAIGTAVSMFPRVRREDFRAVAVLSLTDGAQNLNPLPPCGVCSEWLEKIVEVNPNFRVVTFNSTQLQHINLSSLAPLGSALKHIAEESSVEPAGHGEDDRQDDGLRRESLAVVEEASLESLGSSKSSFSLDRKLSAGLSPRHDVHYELSSASHVLINPRHPTDLRNLELRRTSFSAAPAHHKKSSVTGDGIA